VLNGGAGQDVLNSGSGMDMVTGGLGIDTIDLGVDTDEDILIVGTVAQTAQDQLINFRTEDKLKFSTVTGYTNLAGQGDLIELGYTTFATAIDYVSQQMGGAGKAAGYIYRDNSFLYVNLGGSGYSADEDAIVRLNALQLDTLNGLGASNFIA
jgi:Ca2+-binding RTX toxin-like protein